MAKIGSLEVAERLSELAAYLRLTGSRPWEARWRSWWRAGG
jgi:hypothetical protein